MLAAGAAPAGALTTDRGPLPPGGRTPGALSLYTATSCGGVSCRCADIEARGAVYYYEVAAVNPTGSGALSNPASARAV